MELKNVAFYFAENAPRCGAKTRAGTPCKRLPCTGRTRCNLHGGKSRSGVLAPRWKHGYYSKTWEGDHVRSTLREQEARQRLLDQYHSLDAAGRDRFFRERQKRLAPLLRPHRRAEAAKRYRERKKERERLAA